MWQVLLLFLVGYLLLQYAWDVSRGTALERAIIEVATVQTSVALINSLTPDVAAVAQGSRIVARGGGINVRSGCEGTELLFPLIAALVAFRFSWRVRWAGLGAGVLLVFALNQLRLLALFYSFRSNPRLFGELHALIGPLAMVIVMLILFALLAQWDMHRQANAVR